MTSFGGAVGAHSKTRKRRGQERAVAGREQILAAAREIGKREGWRAVTIRAVASRLGYASPVLYEHFRDKEDLLTQIGLEAMGDLQARVGADFLPVGGVAEARAALDGMVQGYWAFLRDEPQLYRLVNGMDGVEIDKGALNQAAVPVCRIVSAAVRPLLGTQATEGECERVADALWALIHGMAMLSLDRLAAFNAERVTWAALRLVEGAGPGGGVARYTNFDDGTSN